MTSSLPRKRSTPELHRPRSSSRNLNTSGRRDSNPRPSAWKADALPTELLPPPLWLKKYRGESRIRTYEGESQQIYSLPQLTALVSPLCHNNKKRTTPTLPCSRAGGGTRTLDLLITNQLLYQLSYAGKAPSSQGLLPKIHLKRRCKGRSFILTNQTFGAKFYTEPPHAPSCGSFNNLFSTL